MRITWLGLVFVTAVALAQSGDISARGAEVQPALKSGVADLLSAAQIQEKANELMAEARQSSAGLATTTLERYPHHLTMLTVRTRSGSAEVHARYADIFVALDGEAEVITGGTVVDSKVSSPGETRGAQVDGGVSHPMHKGDVLHISAGVPHQTTVPPGKTFTYYVVKIEQ